MEHPRLQRMWFNQPSTLQQFHKYHGTNVLVNMKSTYHSNAVDIWFLSGSIISMRVTRNALSEGWL